MAIAKDLILVTGCSGRIGARVAQRFGQNYQVVGFDVVEPKERLGDMDFVYMDLSSNENVKKGFEYVQSKYGNKVISMIHLAAYYSFSKGSPELYEKITVQGTGRVLKNLKNMQCDQFIFSSTQLVHAPCAVGETINEDSPIVPDWDYPKSKVETEALIHRERGSIASVIMRIAGCYDDECHSIPISNQIQRIYEHQFASRVYPGNLTHGAPFLHLDDLVDAIWMAVEKRKLLPEDLTVLISEDKTMSYDELQRTISRLISGHEFTTYRIPKWFAKIGAWAQDHTPFMEESFIKPWMIDLADNHYQIDITKARQILGWQPKHYIKTTLPIMINFLKADPLRFYQVNGLQAPRWLKRKFEKKI